MLPLDRFTHAAQEALMRGQGLLTEFGHTTFEPEHLLVALLEAPQGVIPETLKELDLDGRALAQRVRGVLAQQPRVPGGTQIYLGPRTKRAMDAALAAAGQRGDAFVGAEHLLVSALAEGGAGARLVATAGLTPDRIAKALKDVRGSRPMDSPTAENQARVLAQYTVDLTQLARDNQLDPVIGRDEEVTRLMEVLSRRTKNNPVLIGPPGVGKTAIAEGLAQRIAAETVPEPLLGKRVLALDIGALLAGSKFRGEFEERIKGVIQEVQDAKGTIILFIDEVHTLVGTGGGEGAIDAGNLLKPALARGQLRAIGATTPDEYRQHIEQDPALERRFQPVYVGPPDQETAIKILEGLRPKYEEHHQLRIADEALAVAVKLADRYISARYLPDKAIDVMDEAAAKVRLRASTRHPEVAQQIARARRIGEEEEQAAVEHDYERAMQLRQERLALEEALADQQPQPAQHAVSAKDVAEVIAKWTGVPVTNIYTEDAEKLLHLEAALHERLVGQEEAVVAVSDAIRRSRSGLADPRRPIGSFLFLGPTGVGKTELAKSLAAYLFDNEDALLRLDMSEYMEGHNVSRLFGAPPGYVGYDRGGQLTEAVRRRPYQVILFDEVEKAHPEVFNALLQILEDGRLTDGQGHVVDFRNTVVIMTSNVGTSGLTLRAGPVGFFGGAAADEAERQLRDRIMESLRRTFRPEFLNRIDETIVFHRLTRPQLRAVVDKMLSDLRERLTERDIELTLTAAARDWLLDRGYDEAYGARPLRRLIQREIENTMARGVLAGDYTAGDRVRVDVVDDRLTWAVEHLIVPSTPTPVEQPAAA